MLSMRKFAQMLIVAVMGGLLFDWAQIPLPWMLGAVTFTMAWRFGFKKEVHLHDHLRSGTLIILGYTVGASFTRDTGALLARHLPYMLLSTLLLVGVTFLFAFFMRKWLGEGKSTSLISSMPGGLSQMVILAQETKGANVSVVVLSHSVRVIAIIYAVPFLVVHFLGAKVIAGPGVPISHQTGPWYVSLVFALACLAGFWAAGRLRFPTPQLLGPLLAVILLIYCGLTPPELPAIAVVIAQLLMGISLTSSMKQGGLSSWKKLIPFTAAVSLALIVLCMGIAYLLNLMTSLDYITAFLSVAAGGLAEMALTGAMVGSDLPVITAYQLFRILFILIVISPLLRRSIRKHTHEAANV